MGAVRMSLQTDKNITIIQSKVQQESNPSINGLWNEKLRVFKKQIHH